MKTSRTRLRSEATARQARFARRLRHDGAVEQCSALRGADVRNLLWGKEIKLNQSESNVAPAKLVGTRVKVPPVELGCSRRNTTSTASP